MIPPQVQVTQISPCFILVSQRDLRLSPMDTYVPTRSAAVDSTSMVGHGRELVPSEDILTVWHSSLAL